MMIFFVCVRGGGSSLTDLTITSHGDRLVSLTIVAPLLKDMNIKITLLNLFDHSIIYLSILMTFR